MNIKKIQIPVNFLNLVFVIVFPIQLLAQFAGSVGTANTSAIYKDSAIFSNWAIGCIIQRGYQDIAYPTLGVASVGTTHDGIGKAGTNGVISLGDGGSSVFTFQYPIKNGEGFDFAVFENAFNDNFLELAFVEVSSDGINYFRFPATSNTQINTQIGPFDNTSDATKINNLAGKYRAQYGTPFDLEELNAIIGLNINQITHLKIIDVVGCISPLYASYDQYNKVINDPYPTAFASGGFDIDAIGVIHQNIAIGINESSIETYFSIFPNPSNSYINIIDSKNIFNELQIFNASGILVRESKETTVDLDGLPAGLYIIIIKTNEGINVNKTFIKQ